jgi:hypothetical protein
MFIASSLRQDLSGFDQGQTIAEQLDRVLQTDASGDPATLETQSSFLKSSFLITATMISKGWAV